MSAAKFFAYAAEILKVQPPHITDEPILTQMRRIGIEPRRRQGSELAAGAERALQSDDASLCPKERCADR
jgi:hypothetical protein